MSLLQRLFLAYGSMPYHRGKWWVVERAIGRFPTLSEFHGRLRRQGFLLDLDCRHCVLDRQLAYLGCYERNEMKALQTLVRPGSTVLDVGANIGYVALELGRMVGQSGKVYAFEPFPETFTRLEAHLNLNGMKWVNPWQVALTERTGKAAGVRGAFVGWSHLARSDERAAETVELATTTIDEFVKSREVPRLDFIKIDVEGAETAVLNGGEGAILRYKPAMMIELNSTDVPARLREWGYSLFLAGRRGLRPFNDSSWKRGVAEANLFALPQGRDCG